MAEKLVLLVATLCTLAYCVLAPIAAYKRIGSGMVVSLYAPGLLIGMLAAAGYVLWWLRAKKRTEILRNDYRLCVKCRHSLAGLRNCGTCPECGTSFNADDVARIWRMTYFGNGSTASLPDGYLRKVHAGVVLHLTLTACCGLVFIAVLPESGLCSRALEGTWRVFSNYAGSAGVFLLVTASLWSGVSPVARHSSLLRFSAACDLALLGMWWAFG